MANIVYFSCLGTTLEYEVNTDLTNVVYKESKLIFR